MHNDVVQLFAVSVDCAHRYCADDFFNNNIIGFLFNFTCYVDIADTYGTELKVNWSDLLCHLVEQNTQCSTVMLFTVLLQASYIMQLFHAFIPLCALAEQNGFTLSY